jgi:REP element-mobilizing transposase RayT
MTFLPKVGVAYLYYNSFSYLYYMQNGIEFFTATCLKWQPLLQPDEHKEIIMNSLKFLIEDKRIWLYGYVIMPNHIHVVLAFKNSDKTINTIIGNGKRFMAYEIVNRLKEGGQTEILQQMERAVEKKDREREKGRPGGPAGQMRPSRATW